MHACRVPSIVWVTRPTCLGPGRLGLCVRTAAERVGSCRNKETAAAALSLVVLADTLCFMTPGTLCDQPPLDTCRPRTISTADRARSRSRSGGRRDHRRDRANERARRPSKEDAEASARRRAAQATCSGKGTPGGSTTEAVVSGLTLPTSAPRDPVQEEAQTAAPRSAADCRRRSAGLRGAGAPSAGRFAGWRSRT